MKQFGLKVWGFIRRHPFISSAALIVLVLAAVVLRLALAIGLIGPGALYSIRRAQSAHGSR